MKDTPLPVHLSTVSAFLAERRSHAAATLTEPAPSATELDAILTVAMRVPDHGKLAPWRFIVYRGTQRARIGAYLAARAEHLARVEGQAFDSARRAQEETRFTRAPLVVGLLSRAAAHPKIPLWEQHLSAGAVGMALLCATHAAGFFGQWLTEWYAYDALAARYLGAEPDERFAGFFHIGRATVTPGERARPILADIVTHWDAPADDALE